MSPIAAISVAAVVTPTPGIVISRLISGLVERAAGRAGDRRARSRGRGSRSGAGRPATVWCSSAAAPERPATRGHVCRTGRSAGERPLRLRISTAVISFLVTRPCAHQLRAAGGQPAQQPGLLIGDPDPGDEIGGEQLGERAGVELVVFDLRVADRADLHRVGDHDLGDERLEASARSPARCRCSPG